MKRRWTLALGSLALVAILAVYFFDPPWVGGVTSGLGAWQIDASGQRFRWTEGRASFYVPSDASVMRLPLRAGFPGPDGMPVIVQIDVDDRRLAEIALADPNAWIRTVLPLPRRQTSRHFRRVDLRVSRTIGDAGLGVQAAEVELERSSVAR